MQSLWSRAGRSQSSCRCVSCLSTTANGVASRSAGAASKKRLRIGNSVTALYTSIFAAAALADARAKTQRRNDWEEKIAAVKAEVDVLVDEEQRILESLQNRRKSRGVHRLLHTRGLVTTSNFTSAPRQRATLARPTRSYHTTKSGLANATAAEIQDKLLEEMDVFDPEEEDLVLEQQPLPNWVLKEPLRMKAIQKLALKQFAIRLLLRPAVAHRYSGVKMNYAPDFEVPKINVDRLLDELNSIRGRMKHLREDKNAHYEDLTQGLTKKMSDQGQRDKASRFRERLDAELDQDIHLYMCQEMSLQELLLRISQNLMVSKEPDRTAAFRAILIAFTRTRQNDLCDMALKMLIPNQFYLSTSLVITILAFFRKSKNLKDFDLFLQMLSGEGYAINIGFLGYYRTMKINGVDIVVPPMDSNNPVLYTELIAASLRFDQPDRADAYLQAARRAGFFDNYHTLAVYLRFYSIRQDWEKGSSALKRAITYLVSSTDPTESYVPRLLVRMVQLCDSCNRKDVSQALIDAAVHSGFDPNIPLEQDELTPIYDLEGNRWKEAANIFGEYLSRLETSESASKSQQFDQFSAQYAHHSMIASLANVSGQTRYTRTMSSSSPILQPEVDLSEKTQPQNQQSEELASMKIELAQLRQLVFQMREHHIESSFKDDDTFHEDHVKPSLQNIQTPPAPANDTEDPHMSIKFERKSTPTEEKGPPLSGKRRRAVSKSIN
ncbi:hypothetical protein N7509_002821 [Penicillium cosmopolitanum]|uniref:Uncharacterized protein n=1 Tax=Penicillium cosmopolitanum TaxID=1131564 RepID=A0A9W9W9Z3_9EURO|nr:uncharacterized protein N7509_002821 [Penicillium cosmopolitanum]KAJ5408938.1 hypothetical protein N7509_002821 [Penicillium cosmopolitanum]